jgi:hypothetical protein
MTYISFKMLLLEQKISFFILLTSKSNTYDTAPLRITVTSRLSETQKATIQHALATAKL